MTTTFKQFLSESAADKIVFAMAQQLLGTKNIESHEALSQQLMAGAKLIHHKYVDTVNGPWVLKQYQKGEDQFVQADPPRPGMNEHKKFYFTPVQQRQTTEDVISSVGEIYEATRLHNVIGRIFDSNQFTYHAATKTFSTEASDIHGFDRQLWNDSADVGFGIRSKNTGNVVLFTHEKTHRDDEGYITHWTFDAYNPHNDPKLHGLKVTVFND
jgi:hypothetical protein